MPIGLVLQRVLFGLLCLALAVGLTERLRPILPLYLNAQTRSAVRSALETAAEREGWLLSDVALREIRADRARLTHRTHNRGPVHTRCFDLSLPSAVLTPCDS